LRGKSIRFRAKVRATARDASGWAALWLRVDRPNRAMGFFDNMDDRKIREAEWRAYTIEGKVADDAVAVAFGVMAFGPATADFDAVELCVPGADDTCAQIPILDPGFEAALDKRGGWMRAGTSKNARVSHVGESAPEGRQFLRFEPPAAGSYDGFVNVMQTLTPAELFEEGAPTAGAHVDVELGSGLLARVPLALTDAQARRASLDALNAALSVVAGPPREPDLDSRLADVVVAWNVFRHFYPCWTEAAVDWDASLRAQLVAARAAETRAAQRDALRRLVADARDGHGSATDTLLRDERARLPIQLGVVEERLAITATATPSVAPVGAVITQIDGLPAAQRLAEAMRLFSGTEQWRRVRALWELTRGPQGDAVKLGLDDGAERREVTLRYEGTSPPPERRPEPMAELEPQLWYVDLTRTKMADVTPRLETLAAARGVIFDLRGYPGDAGSGILPHLLDAPESDRWMHVAKLVGPFGRAVGWQGYGWDLKPARPRLAGKIVFMTDGGAISYAESVMGYVADRKLGTIVGGATAGTNGNVASFDVPSGFRLTFTGMRVTRHDGQAPHHLIGVQPDIPIAPTIAGLRGGRDEVLERARALIR
jgi:C-terminal processing protease CtpA/Prc